MAERGIKGTDIMCFDREKELWIMSVCQIDRGIQRGV